MKVELRSRSSCCFNFAMPKPPPRIFVPIRCWIFPLLGIESLSLPSLLQSLHLGPAQPTVKTRLAPYSLKVFLTTFRRKRLVKTVDFFPLFFYYFSPPFFSLFYCLSSLLGQHAYFPLQVVQTTGRPSLICGCPFTFIFFAYGCLVRFCHPKARVARRRGWDGGVLASLFLLIVPLFFHLPPQA